MLCDDRATEKSKWFPIKTPKKEKFTTINNNNNNNKFCIGKWGKYDLTNALNILICLIAFSCLVERKTSLIILICFVLSKHLLALLSPLLNFPAHTHTHAMWCMF